jgi:hypothetical protein
MKARQNEVILWTAAAVLLAFGLFWIAGPN